MRFVGEVALVPCSLFFTCSKPGEWVWPLRFGAKVTYRYGTGRVFTAVKFAVHMTATTSVTVAPPCLFMAVLDVLARDRVGTRKPSVGLVGLDYIFPMPSSVGAAYMAALAPFRPRTHAIHGFGSWDRSGRGSRCKCWCGCYQYARMAIMRSYAASTAPVSLVTIARPRGQFD